MKNKLVFGVGINDADYVIKKSLSYIEDGKRKRKQLWACPYYNKWSSMLTRCYSSKFLQKNPTYKGCSVCQEWLTFSNFKAWMETQDWEGKQLDKDILLINNKIYSPETCVFVEQKVNLFLNDLCVGNIGSCWNSKANKYMAQCSDGKGGNKTLGLFDTAEEAHLAWKKAKHDIAIELSYNQSDIRIREILLNRYA